MREQEKHCMLNINTFTDFRTWYFPLPDPEQSKAKQSKAMLRYCYFAFTFCILGNQNGFLKCIK